MTAPPHAGTVLFTASAVVEAPVDAVAEAAITRLGATAGDPHVLVDPDRWWYAVQGDWWYRGVYVLTAHDHAHNAGTRIDYTAHNIARRARFMVNLIRLYATKRGVRPLSLAAG